MRRLAKLLAVAAVLAGTGCGYEPDRQGHASSAAAAAASSVETVVAQAPSPKPRPLDLKAIELERVDYAGLPPSEVLDAVMRLNPNKDKYESDAEHAKRMKAAEEAQLLDGIKVSDLVGFTPTEVHFRYDANRQEWQYDVWPSEVGAADFGNVQVYSETLPAAQFPHFAHVYPGRDLVFKKSIHLRVANLKGLSYIVGAVKVPREQARELEDLLTVLLVGRLAPVRVTSAQKLPLKYDEREVNYGTALAFKLEGAWLVNKRDGRVLSKTWRVRRDA